MKLASIVDGRFMEAFNRLIKCRMPIKTAYELKTINKQINEEYRKYDELRLEIMARFASKDKSGEIQLDEHGNAIFEKAQMSHFMEEMQKLLDVEITISKVEAVSLGDINISAEDLDLLEGILTQP